MSFLICLSITLACALLLEGPIKSHPGVFYAIAALSSLLYSYCWLSGELLLIPLPLRVGMRSCLVGVSFLVVVMYLGVLPEACDVRKRLAPIRAELSIIGSFLCAGHIATFASAYLGRISGTFLSDVAFAIGAALILTALLIVLTATSFLAVKRRMNAQQWKKLHRLSYPFYGLIFAHLVWFVAPRAFSGSWSGLFDLIAYVLVFGIYAVLKIKLSTRAR